MGLFSLSLYTDKRKTKPHKEVKGMDADHIPKTEKYPGRRQRGVPCLSFCLPK